MNLAARKPSLVQSDDEILTYCMQWHSKRMSRSGLIRISRPGLIRISRPGLIRGWAAGKGLTSQLNLPPPKRKKKSVTSWWVLWHFAQPQSKAGWYPSWLSFWLAVLPQTMYLFVLHPPTRVCSRFHNPLSSFRRSIHLFLLPCRWSLPPAWASQWLVSVLR